jgi:hypothetical protein
MASQDERLKAAVERANKRWRVIQENMEERDRVMKEHRAITLEHSLAYRKRKKTSDPDYEKFAADMATEDKRLFAVIKKMETEQKRKLDETLRVD